MPEPEGVKEPIFYAKFLFDAIGNRFAAFELSYPRFKESFDGTLTHLEKSLRSSD